MSEKNKKKQTECLLGLHSGDGKLAANGDLLEHAGNLEVAGSSEVSSIDRLDVVSDSNVGNTGLQR
jgi:hypothetical protein